MMELVQGNEAVVRAALKVGCRFFAGYPITPSSEIMHMMAREMPKVGGVFIQMEDEIASLSAAIGASMAGKISMTATSGPGFSLMQENIGYAAITETPVVIVNVMRAGPSTGIPTAPSQGDVMQARFGSHGDYPIIVLALSDVLDSYLLTARAFYLSEKFLTPVIVLSDELVGHMRESVELPELEEIKPKRKIIGGGEPVHFTGLAHKDGFAISDPEEYEALIKRLHRKIEGSKEITSYKIINPDSDVLIVTYGSPFRSSLALLKTCRNVGILKLETLFPFPDKLIEKLTKNVEKVVVVEMNVGKIYREISRVYNGDLTLVSKLAQPISPDYILKVIECQ
ncbi:2-oxoglutarate synthase subunit alpha [Archaeoglobales archaeon ex4484_92]|nr:MAG: 2-oxoglutarate synthase subunit alpha [Archaeoglobales archaeon ex4484_92]